ncbi:unnamed protein product [Caenorhabditis brenneri]
MIQQIVGDTHDNSNQRITAVFKINKEAKGFSQRFAATAEDDTRIATKRIQRVSRRIVSQLGEESEQHSSSRQIAIRLSSTSPTFPTMIVKQRGLSNQDSEVRLGYESYLKSSNQEDNVSKLRVVDNYLIQEMRHKQAAKDNNIKSKYNVGKVSRASSREQAERMSKSVDMFIKVRKRNSPPSIIKITQQKIFKYSSQGQHHNENADVCYHLKDNYETFIFKNEQKQSVHLSRIQPRFKLIKRIVCKRKNIPKESEVVTERISQSIGYRVGNLKDSRRCFRQKEFESSRQTTILVRSRAEVINYIATQSLKDQSSCGINRKESIGRQSVSGYANARKEFMKAVGETIKELSRSSAGHQDKEIGVQGTGPRDEGVSG